MAARYFASNREIRSSNKASASAVEPTGVASRSLFSIASFPPIETTTCDASEGTLEHCDASSVVVAPSTARSVARHPAGKSSFKCATTSGCPPGIRAVIENRIPE